MIVHPRKLFFSKSCLRNKNRKRKLKFIKSHPNSPPLSNANISSSNGKFEKRNIFVIWWCYWRFFFFNLRYWRTIQMGVIKNDFSVKFVTPSFCTQHFMIINYNFESFCLLQVFKALSKLVSEMLNVLNCLEKLNLSIWLNLKQIENMLTLKKFNFNYLIQTHPIAQYAPDRTCGRRGKSEEVCCRIHANA